MVAEQLGRPFRPSHTVLIEAVPHTRSNKILRRALRAAATGEDAGDLSSAEDPALIERIRVQLGSRGKSVEPSRRRVAQSQPSAD